MNITTCKMGAVAPIEEKLPPSEQPREPLHITELSVKHRLVALFLIVYICRLYMSEYLAFVYIL